MKSLKDRKGLGNYVPSFLLFLVVLVFFFLIQNAQSQTALTADHFFVNLMENKADLTYGMTIFEFRNPLSEDLLVDTSNFKIRVENQPGATPVQNIRYYVLESTDYSENITDYKTQCETSTAENGTSQICEQVASGWHWNNYTNEKWKEFTSYTFKAGQTYRIKVQADWQPKLGFQSREWFPEITVAGITYEQSAWAWWNSSWNRCKNLTFSGGASSRVMEIIDVNITNLTFSNATNEIRIVEYPCILSPSPGAGGVPSNVTSWGGNTNGNKWAKVVFHHNGTATYSVYYDNPIATAPSYPEVPFNESIVFDNDNWLSNWQCYSEINTLESTPSTERNSADNSLKVDYTGNTYDWFCLNNQTAPNPDRKIRHYQMEVKNAGGGGNWFGMAFRVNTSIVGYSIRLYDGGYSPYIVWSTHGSETLLSSGSNSYAIGTWWRLEARIDTENTTNAETDLEVLVNDTSKANVTHAALQYHTGRWGIQQSDSGGGGQVTPWARRINITSGRFYSPPSTVSIGEEITRPQCNGTLIVNLMQPAENQEFVKNESFTLRANITCTGGCCGNVNATADPSQILSETNKAQSVLPERRMPIDYLSLIYGILIGFAPVVVSASLSKLKSKRGKK